MKIRKIITVGCSFSDPTTPYTWPNQLESYILKNVDDSVKFDHRGLSSQGQELIQKKASHAIYEALMTGYKSEEIAVFVMWSSIDRKSFYIDNSDMINEIVENWKGTRQGWSLQFADLKNDTGNIVFVETKASDNNRVYYNPKGGWFITSAHVTDEIKFVRDYFMMGKDAVSPGLCNDNIENILFLQYLCNSKNIRLYQQYYMDNIKEDLSRHRTHQAVQYLYDDLDMKTFISQRSMHEYLSQNPELFVSPNNRHPNGLGHRIWLTEVIIPKLDQDNFFE